MGVSSYGPGQNITLYSSQASFPAAGNDGDLAVALDAGALFIYNLASTSWKATGGLPLTGGTLTGTLTAPTVAVFTVRTTPASGGGILFTQDGGGIAMHNGLYSDSGQTCGSGVYNSTTTPQHYPWDWTSTNVLMMGYAKGDSLTTPTTGTIKIKTGTNLTLDADNVIVKNSATPASATAAGVAGTITWDASYIYVCTATNTWKRAAIAAW